MNNLKLLLGGMALTMTMTVHGQGARNIVISEVMTDNDSSIVDEFGNRNAWIELENTSYTTYNVRGMYLTTNRAVLSKKLRAPERISMMSVIPNGDERTNIGPRQHLLLFANARPNDGKMHMALDMPEGESLWVALYNGNGVELIDSVSIPALKPNTSYARQADGHWAVAAESYVTPGIENTIGYGKTRESGVDKFKKNDPHGFAMAIMAMGIVFLCLALLWLFFSAFGTLMRHLDTAKKVAHQQPMKPITVTVEKTIEIGHKTGNIMQEGLQKKGIDMEVYMAVIGMALKQYEDDVHDVESGIITIKSKDTEWDDEYSQMTHWHDPVHPKDHNAPRIPTTPELH